MADIPQLRPAATSYIVRCGASVNRRGLAFHFLRQLDASRPVFNGHDAGDITINAIKSNPVQRERCKLDLHEP